MQDKAFLSVVVLSCSFQHDIVTCFLSVSLSVRHTLVLYQKHIVMLSSPHDSPFILVLCVYKIFAKFRRGHPLRGR